MHVQNRILCKAADLSRQPVLGKSVCSDSNSTAQQLQMAARKSLETMSGAILNLSQPRFAAQSVANEMLPVLGKDVCSFELNSTATSDGSAHKLGNDV